MVRVTYPGGYGKANVGISNDKEGKIPCRRKTKVSRAMSIIPGSVGSYVSAERRGRWQTRSTFRDYLQERCGDGAVKLPRADGMAR